MEKKKIGILVCLCLFIWANAGQAASIYMAPSSVKTTTGSNTAISVYVSSEDQALNATSGTVKFPTDKLKVSSVTKGSLINLWISEPSVDNVGGAVNFDGVVLNPGFKGRSRKIMTINMKALSEGSATLSFSNPRVLANDGLGTSILTSSSPAIITIGKKAPVKIPAEPTEEKLTPPTLNPLPEQILSSDSLSFSGKTEKPGTEVIISVLLNGVVFKEVSLKSNEQGDFSYTYKKLEPGYYTLSAKIIGLDGKESTGTALQLVNVQEEAICKDIKNKYTNIIVGLGAFQVLALAAIWMAFRRREKKKTFWK